MKWSERIRQWYWSLKWKYNAPWRKRTIKRLESDKLRAVMKDKKFVNTALRRFVEKQIKSDPGPV